MHWSSLVFGFAFGVTEVKCSNALLKASTKSAKGAFNVTKAVADIKTASRVTEKAKTVLKGTSTASVKFGTAKEGLKKIATKTHDVIHVTPQGVAIPPSPKYQIPKHYVENSKQWGSGKMGFIANEYLGLPISHK